MRRFERHVALALQNLHTAKYLGPVEPFLRRLVGERVLFGPLRGARFPYGNRKTWLGTYEHAVQSLLVRYLKPSSVFYDVGAHYGYMTLLASRLVTGTGAVYCFEPSTDNMKRLVMTLKVNRVSNVYPIPRAVSLSTGRAELYLGEGGNAYRPSLSELAGGTHYEVQTTSLDAFCEAHRRPALVKIDVEGAEAKVLAGAVGLLSSKLKPTLIIEVHSLDLRSQVEELLADFRYGLKRIEGSGRREFPHHVLAKPREPTREVNSL